MEYELIVAEEGYEPITKSVMVHNPIHAVFLPFIGRSFGSVP